MFELTPFERRTNSLLNLFDSMERDMFGSLESSVAAIRTDISEDDDKYLIEAELPGFKKEDIHIDVENNMLTISAEHKEESEDKKKGYIRKERRYGSFKRSFDLSGVDASNIDASYNDGILTLALPKLVKKPDTTRRIELK